ncbi:unnamed protein product [Rhizophagus irregularis]|uniref:Uncharacterized protein n=1 Tax=Rhizophagus irregularis TaxID=588596 RepID=A0A916EF88_9GLOM|nr:unnamed protein product [Rhizophagus irregularis]CAB5197542.1 unnamed protein product [Rhizophagus irregularis]CAB5383148.1 unnamed protein product [Rhizophagus irregularis]
MESGEGKEEENRKNEGKGKGKRRKVKWKDEEMRTREKEMIKKIKKIRVVLLNNFNYYKIKSGVRRLYYHPMTEYNKELKAEKEG